MLNTIYKIVENAENRQRDMKKINIYTLNYDNIVENILNSEAVSYTHLDVYKRQVIECIVLKVFVSQYKNFLILNIYCITM